LVGRFVVLVVLDSIVAVEPGAQVHQLAPAAAEREPLVWLAVRQGTFYLLVAYRARSFHAAIIRLARRFASICTKLWEFFVVLGIGVIIITRFV
jgi:hypothetical protein